MTELDTTSRGRAAALWTATCLAAIALVWLGSLLGAWYAPFVVGLVAGLGTRRLGRTARGALGTGCLAALAGWLLPIGLRAVEGQPVLGTGRTVAALAGLPADGLLILAVTGVVAVLQALIGVWLGRAIGPRRG